MLAIAIPCFTIPSQVFQLTPGDFDLDSSLPLQLCDFAWVTAVWGLWTHQRLPVAVTYFWALTLTIQGILTPSLGQVFPEPRFFMFWCMHFLIVWSALYLTLGLGIGPDWRCYRITVALTPRLGGRWSTPSTWRRRELRLPGAQAGLRVVARPAGPVAGVRVRVAGDPARGLGADDLAVGGARTRRPVPSLP